MDLHKEVEYKEDGRRIIYYTFSGEEEIDSRDFLSPNQEGD